MTVELGRFGAWRRASTLTPELAAEVEALGYGAIWIGGSPGDLQLAQDLLDATSRIAVATGIVNIWAVPAEEAAASYHRIVERHPTGSCSVSVSAIQDIASGGSDRLIDARGSGAPRRAPRCRPS